MPEPSSALGSMLILQSSALTSSFLERVKESLHQERFYILLCSNKLLTSRRVCSLFLASRLPSPLSISHLSRHTSLYVYLPYLPNWPETHFPHSAPPWVSYLSFYCLVASIFWGLHPQDSQNQSASPLSSLLLWSIIPVSLVLKPRSSQCSHT